jgi:hypothetical protein
MYLKYIVCGHEPLVDVKRMATAHDSRTDTGAEQKVECRCDYGWKHAVHEWPGVHTNITVLKQAIIVIKQC